VEQPAIAKIENAVCADGFITASSTWSWHRTTVCEVCRVGSVREHRETFRSHSV